MWSISFSILGMHVTIGHSGLNLDSAALTYSISEMDKLHSKRHKIGGMSHTVKAYLEGGGKMLDV